MPDNRGRKGRRPLHGKDRAGFDSPGETDSTLTIYNFMYRNRTRFDPAAFLPFSDTIVYEHHFPVWLFTFGMSSSGPSISRINGKECHTTAIYEIFTKGKALGSDVVAVFATIDKIGAQYDYACHYVDRDHLMQFLLEPPEHGVLQKFVAPHGIHNDEVRVHWTPNFVAAERWENKHQWKDMRVGLQTRLSCHIGAAAGREVATSPDQIRIVEQKLNLFMEQTLKYEKKEIRSIVFHLKLDSNAVMHFLWISSVDMFSSQRMKATTNFKLNDPRALQALSLDPLKNRPARKSSMKPALLEEAAAEKRSDQRKRSEAPREEAEAEFLDIEEKSVGSSSSSLSGTEARQTATEVLKRLTTVNAAQEEFEKECEPLRLPEWVFESLDSDEEIPDPSMCASESRHSSPKHPTRLRRRIRKEVKKKDMVIMRYGRADVLTEYLRDIITSKKEEVESSYESWLRSCDFRQSNTWKFEATSKTDMGTANWLSALRKKNRQRSLSLKPDVPENTLEEGRKRKGSRSFRLASQSHKMDKSAISLAEELGVEVGITFNVERHDATDVFNPNPLFCDSDEETYTSHILYPGTFAREAVEAAADHFALPHIDFSILKDKCDLVSDEHEAALEYLHDCQYCAYSQIVEDSAMLRFEFELPRALFKVQWFAALLARLGPGFRHEGSSETLDSFSISVKRRGELMALSKTTFEGLLEETERRYANAQIKLFFPHYESNPLNKRPQWSEYSPVSQSLLKRARKQRRNFSRDTFSSPSVPPPGRGSIELSSPLQPTSSRVRFQSLYSLHSLQSFRRPVRERAASISSGSSGSSGSDKDEVLFHPDPTLEV